MSENLRLDPFGEAGGLTTDYTESTDKGKNGNDTGCGDVAAFNRRGMSGGKDSATDLF